MKQANTHHMCYEMAISIGEIVNNAKLTSCLLDLYLDLSMPSHDWSTNNLHGFLDTLDWKRVYRTDTTSERHGTELSTPRSRGPSVVHKPVEVVGQYPAVAEKPNVSEWKTDNLQGLLSTLDWQSVHQGGKAPPPKEPEHD